MQLYNQELNLLEQRRNSLKVISVTASSILFPSLFIGCGSSGDKPTGKLIVYIRELYSSIARDTDNFQKIDLSIKDIQVQKSNGKWISLLREEEKIDLVDNVVGQTIVEKQIPIGSYNKVRLFISSVDAIMDDMDSEVNIPANIEKNGLTIDYSFTVEESKSTYLELNFDVPKALTKTPNSSYPLSLSTFVSILNANEAKKVQKDRLEEVVKIEQLFEEYEKTGVLPDKLKEFSNKLGETLTSEEIEYLESFDVSEEGLKEFVEELSKEEELILPFKLQSSTDKFFNSLAVINLNKKIFHSKTHAIIEKGPGHWEIILRLVKILIPFIKWIWKEYKKWVEETD